jgi:uncharacterized protein (DUF1697 family)
MAERTGVSAHVIVLDAEEVAAAVANDPLKKSTVNRRSSWLRSRIVPPTARSSSRSRSGAGRPGARPREARAYLWCPEGIHASPLALSVWRAAGDGVTARNWATMTKLKALLDEEP